MNQEHRSGKAERLGIIRLIGKRSTATLTYHDVVVGEAKIARLYDSSLNGETPQSLFSTFAREEVRPHEHGLCPTHFNAESGTFLDRLPLPAAEDVSPDGLLCEVLWLTDIGEQTRLLRHPPKTFPCAFARSGSIPSNEHGHHPEMC